MGNGNFFAVSMSGEETLTNDLNNFCLLLQRPIRAGLSSVADGFTQSLNRHIQSDVYEAYQPKRYPRRAFGDSLASPKYQHVSIGDMSLSFQYEPKGFHSGRMKDMLGAEFDPNIHEWVYYDRETGATNPIENPNDPIKPHPVHGDRLIQRIQTGRGYDWKPPKGLDEFPKRPFWDNFVEEQKNGAAIQNFSYGFNQGEFKLTLEGGSRDIEWQGGEGMIEAGIVIDDEDF